MLPSVLMPSLLPKPTEVLPATVTFVRMPVLPKESKPPPAPGVAVLPLRVLLVRATTPAAAIVDAAADVGDGVAVDRALVHLHRAVGVVGDAAAEFRRYCR